MPIPQIQAAEADGLTKEEALRAAFEELGVPSDAWEGDSSDDIRRVALEALELGPSEVTIRVLSEGTKGLLGLGGKSARVRVSLQEAADTSPADILRDIIDLMGIDADVEAEVREDELYLNIDTDDVALLIGRHGTTLDAIQYLVNSAVSKTSDVRQRIVVNAGEYREKREDMLVEMAHQAARRARATGREVPLEPMSPRDRRIVHMTLRDDEDVRTFSRDEGRFRAVVVAPSDS
ncbi:KH domain-containing protein [Candidatus Poribacteria bacterium]|jgi:spoIIIJ-associated protein|nr:KH domain-containing protein [Candidatus Poribacteria bacterium]MBT5533367.1 KH domain-containing protein [Candidatus Poribacteria bacterium]MBT5712485.1 KH domain-containing protein [Candidatus Poribacteria bacterium]MBT7100178.1 KH domain-containing protein [Candidatus Poribacteria bacterium]MBT7807997.1 KH domain-containing protein [Candidatus Poribacteria bacterium]